MSLTTINGTPACDGLYLLPFVEMSAETFSLVIDQVRHAYYEKVEYAIKFNSPGLSENDIILVAPMSLIRWNDEE